MYLSSDQMRDVELRARQLRAEMVRNFFVTLFAKRPTLPGGAAAKHA